MSSPRDTDNKPEYIGNQISGGVIVAENIRAAYRAIAGGMTGQTEVKCILMSLPKDDLEKLKPELQKVEEDYQAQTAITRNTIKKSYLKSDKMKGGYQLQVIEQNRSLEIIQVVITFLDSIGQWWMKKAAIERGYLSLYELGEAEEQDD